MPQPVVRLSILRCEPDQFPMFKKMMEDADGVLAPGIRSMEGLIDYFAGADEATSSLSNVSVWETLEHARQMERFAPMADLARQFAEKGARFDRPIMNHGVLWQIAGARTGR